LIGSDNDTKFAMARHEIRATAVEYLQTGKITLPMIERERQVCMDIRQGKMHLRTVERCATSLEDNVKLLIEKRSPLPRFPFKERIMSSYRRYIQNSMKIVVIADTHGRNLLTNWKWPKADGYHSCGRCYAHWKS